MINIYARTFMIATRLEGPEAFAPRHRWWGWRLRDSYATLASCPGGVQ